MTKTMEFYIQDLTPEKQAELIAFLGGDNGNYDVIPFATLEAEEEEDSRIDPEVFTYEETYSGEEQEHLFTTEDRTQMSRILPERMLKGASGMTINVKLPKGSRDPEDASVEASPFVENEDGFEDTDWTDVDLSIQEIEQLLSILSEKLREY